jgi:hypothetical protein
MWQAEQASKQKGRLDLAKLSSSLDPIRTKPPDLETLQ